MQDRIILGNGKANNIKFNLAGINSWEQFVAANAAGTLQADVTYNNDGTGTSVIGTLLNKANLMTDATAEAIGLSGLETDTINDALQLVAEFMNKVPVKFSLTRDSSIQAGAGTGVWDPVSKLVRLSFYWQASAAFATSQTIFTVPPEYCPEGDANRGAAIMGTTTQINTAGAVNVNSGGEVKQIASSANSARGMGYIEYIL